MTPDFAAHIDAVTRSVSAQDRDGAPTRTVTLARSCEAAAGELWDAVTDAERLPRWFLPVSGDLRPGGRYQFEGNAGGTITRCEPQRFVAATWEFAGGMSWVELRLDEEGDERSRLTLSHICPLDDHWKTYGPGAAGVGWDMALVGLVLHLAGAPGLDEEALATSPEGKAFVAGLAEEWRKAAVAAGEDPLVAGKAARRTAAFYTGEAEPED